MLYLYILDLLIIIIVANGKIGSTSITIQTASKSENGFKQFCFQSASVMQYCKTAYFQGKEEKIKFVPLSTRRFSHHCGKNLSNQSCPR